MNMFCFIVFVNLLVKINSQLNCLCTDVVPPLLQSRNKQTNATEICEQQKDFGNCDKEWMNDYCQCTCSTCSESISSLHYESSYVSASSYQQLLIELGQQYGQQLQQQNDENKSPEITSDEADEICTCEDRIPETSTKTCSEVLIGGDCDVMLQHGYCECACEKCKSQQQKENNYDTYRHYQNQFNNYTLYNTIDLQIDPLGNGSLIQEQFSSGAQEQGRQEEEQRSNMQGQGYSLDRGQYQEQDQGQDQPSNQNILNSSDQDSFSSTCVDVVPPESQFTCEKLNSQNECFNEWMKGYCKLTCGVCGVELLANVQAFHLQQTSCQDSCNDNPPPDSEISCEEQEQMGKCEEDWMNGYCECVCGRCDITPSQQSDQNINSQQYMDANEYIDSGQASITSLPIQFSRGIGNIVQLSNFPSPSTFQPQTDQYTDNYQGSNQFNSQLAQNVMYSTPQVPSYPVFKSSQQAFSLTILHFNDIHARILPATDRWWECDYLMNAEGECYGGFARVKTVVDQYRRQEKNLLVLNGGDDFVGTDWDYHDPTNKATSHFLNIIGVDAMAIGNHEFDHGPDTLAIFAQNTNYPLLSCNMDASMEPTLQAVTQKYTIKHMSNFKVGIFGLTTTFTNSAKHADTGKVWFNDPHTAAKECIAQMKSEGVEIIIALSHLGYNADKYLAEKIDGIDVVVGAHSHTFLSLNGDLGPILNHDNGKRDVALGQYPTWVQSRSGKMVPVVQAGWATRYLGKLTVEFDVQRNLTNAYGYPILLGGVKSDNNIPEDFIMKQEIDNWKWW